MTRSRKKPDLKPASSPRPTPEQLALIAAQLLPSCGGDAVRAVAQARRLWKASVDAVTAWEQPAEPVTEGEALLAKATEIDAQPTLSFEQMLERLMPGAKPEDREACFRRYLAATTQSDGVELFRAYRTRELTGWQFGVIAEGFLPWRAAELSKVRSEAGRKGGAQRTKTS